MQIFNQIVVRIPCE